MVNGLPSTITATGWHDTDGWNLGQDIADCGLEEVMSMPPRKRGKSSSRALWKKASEENFFDLELYANGPWWRSFLGISIEATRVNS